MAIYIENVSGTRFDFHYRVALEKAVTTLMEDMHVPESLDVNIMIVAPEEMQQINADNRGIDKVTDVLSFPYFEFKTPGAFDLESSDWTDGDILGDIVLCADKVLSQAQEYGHSQKREMVFLTVHSMLHLMGYDHMEPEDAKNMEAKQEYYMNLLGISR